MTNRRQFLARIAAAAAATVATSALAQPTQSTTDTRRPRQGGRAGAGRSASGRGTAEPFALPADLAHLNTLNLLLGSPTDRSISLSALSTQPGSLNLTCSSKSSTPIAIDLKPSAPADHTLTALTPNTPYTYTATFTPLGHPPITRTGSFHTQRSAVSSFTFTIQGDSHPERPQMCSPARYSQTLANIAADQPDFHICMGDDFSLARIASLSQSAVAQRYRQQRPFLSLTGAPIFLVNGNHEQASLYNYQQQGKAHDITTWAQLSRNSLFPLPDTFTTRFYSGNTTPLPGIGQLRDYLSFTWGDALFVILDNYWHSPAAVDTTLSEVLPPEDEAQARRTGRNRDLWAVTLGDAQYHWLADTLAKSTARYKFVFAHHIHGTTRGGIEVAPLYEWGGRSPRGDLEFKSRRPNWPLPIHDLMVKHRVSAFFQGHDHIYAHQQLDGIVYQTLPIPADPADAIYNDTAYTSGTRLPNSGHLRVTVEPTGARVYYVRSLSPTAAATQPAPTAHSYTIKPNA
jgi:hypothetical protein